MPGLPQTVLPNVRNGNIHRLQVLLPAVLLNDCSSNLSLCVEGTDLLSLPLMTSITSVLCCSRSFESAILDRPGVGGAGEIAREAGLSEVSGIRHSAVATGLEKVSFHCNPKERQCQTTFKLLHNCRGPAPADPGYLKERRRRRGSDEVVPGTPLNS